MTDASTLTARPSALSEGDAGPSITPRRSLPGGRAVVGAFLVVLAAVGTFGAYLQATAEPSTRYLAATGPVDVGRVLTADDVQALFAEVAVDLPVDQAERTVRASQRSALVGTVVVAPVSAHDLLLVSAVQQVGTADPGVQLSVALPPERAVGGQVAVGERVDVIATFEGSGGSADTTRVVARQVGVVATPQDSDGIGGGHVVLTVQVPDIETALRLQFAVDTAEIAVIRGADATAADPAPEDGAVDDATRTPTATAPDEPATATTAGDAAGDDGGDA